MPIGLSDALGTQEMPQHVGVGCGSDGIVAIFVGGNEVFSVSLPRYSAPRRRSERWCFRPFAGWDQTKSMTASSRKLRNRLGDCDRNALLRGARYKEDWILDVGKRIADAEQTTTDRVAMMIRMGP